MKNKTRRRNHNYNYKRVNYIPRNFNQKTLKSIKNVRILSSMRNIFMFADLIEKINYVMGSLNVCG